MAGPIVRIAHIDLNRRRQSTTQPILNDLDDARAAVEIVRQIGAGTTPLDVLPLKRFEDLLSFVTRDADTFLASDAVTRCHLRAGGNRISAKKFADDMKLFHLLREMLGNIRRIDSLDTMRAARTLKFLAGVANVEL